MHHPHLHIVIPGGGLSPDGAQWVPCQRSRRGKDFFLPVRILSRVFRGKFIAGLKQAYAQGKLEFHGQLQSLGSARQFEQLLHRAVRSDWVVYAKRPFGGPRQVLKYLARYTHRVAISNQRLLRLEDGRVTFRYKDYADGQQARTMILDATEFLRRFLLHVLPRGFVRIRHYGLLANRDRHANLNRCRKLLGVAAADGLPQPSEPTPNEPTAPETQPAERTWPCPQCETGRLIVIDLVPAARRARVPRPHFLARSAQRPQFADTS
jgi:hypothetical protein